VRELVDTFDFNDLASLDAVLERQGGDTAVVILEPAGAEEPAPGFLEGVVERAHRAGAVAVFDEIITGFRLAPGGAQERYGVQSDLSTFGKALGNGMPIAALVGRAELMDRLEDVFFSGTHGGEALSLAAARAVLGELDDAAYRQLHEKGETLREGVQSAIDAHGLGDWVTIGGAAPRTVVSVREPEHSGPGLPAKSLLQQELVKRGVLFNGSNFICLAHSDDDIAQAVDAYDAALARLAEGLPDGVAALLEGEPVQAAFRAT
jgi:glutamate-1-semialdehyde aminotransferase